MILFVMPGPPNFKRICSHAAQPRDYFACWRVNFTKGFQGSRLGFEFKRRLYPLDVGLELSGLMRERQVSLKIIFGHVGESSSIAFYVK